MARQVWVTLAELVLGWASERVRAWAERKRAASEQAEARRRAGADSRE